MFFGASYTSHAQCQAPPGAAAGLPPRSTVARAQSQRAPDVSCGPLEKKGKKMRQIVFLRFSGFSSIISVYFEGFRSGCCSIENV